MSKTSYQTDSQLSDPCRESGSSPPIMGVLRPAESCVAPVGGSAPPPIHCRDSAARFLSALTGETDPVVTFQVFRDHKGGGSRATIFHGTLGQHWERLVALNLDGLGVFVLINKGDLKGRTGENVVGLRALFIDDDPKDGSEPVRFNGQGKAPFSALAPSITVQSKNGQHHYWCLVDGEPKEQFTPAQVALSSHFGTDPVVKDLPRVMRVPGFLHMKDPADPFLVTLVQAEAERFTVREILEAYPPRTPPPAVSAPARVAMRAPSRPTGVGENERNAILSRARAYVAAVPPAISGQNGDVATFKLCASLARGFDLSDDDCLTLLGEWNQYCQPPWTEGELREKLGNARKYGQGEIGSLRAARAANDNQEQGDGYTDEICYVVPFERYFYRRPDGCWNVQSPITRKTASFHLQARGFSPSRIDNVLDGNLFDIAYGIECAPDQPATFRVDGQCVLNNYVPPRITPRSGHWPRIKKIMEVITEGDYRGFDYLLNWMAAKVQNPGSRTMTAPVFQGIQGTGKSTLGIILAEILGPENTASISQDDLDGTFNLHYVNKLLVLADEVVNRDNIRATDSKLKKCITDPEIIANGKNVAQFKVRNRMSWWFTSNSPTPVRVEGEHDRRYTVFCCSTPPSPEYKEMLSSLYLPNGDFAPDFVREIEAFAFLLKGWPVDLKRAARPFANAARAELAQAGRSTLRPYIGERYPFKVWVTRQQQERNERWGDESSI